MRGKNLAVGLEPYEVAQAAAAGVARQVDSIRRGLRDKFGMKKESPWHIHIEGACGELAYAKAANRFWGGSVGTFKAPDLAGRIQIRTRSDVNYDLIVRDADNDDDIFVLVVGQAPIYTVVGWITGKDAKQARYLQSHGGRSSAYFVPQADLWEFPIVTSEPTDDDFATKPLDKP